MYVDKADLEAEYAGTLERPRNPATEDIPTICPPPCFLSISAPASIVAIAPSRFISITLRSRLNVPSPGKLLSPTPALAIIIFAPPSLSESLKRTSLTASNLETSSSAISTV